MLLFIIRFFSAIGLYIALTQSNESLGIFHNTILVLGYRSFLIFSPIFLKHIKRFCFSLIFIIALIGNVLILIKLNFIGIILLSFGLSIGGFIIKKTSAEQAHIAGWNKIALSLGNIAVGFLIMFLANTNVNFWIISLVFYSAILFFTSILDRKDNEMLELDSFHLKDLLSRLFFFIRTKFLLGGIFKPTLKKFSTTESKHPKYLIIHLSWLLIGMGIGIRIFGLYTILPQYIINKLGFLPDWYGFILILYSIFVVITQIPAISKKYKFSLNFSLIILISSIFILSLSDLFLIYNPIGAMLWCFLLSLEEIFAPYLDYYASNDKAILTKEVAISLGGGFSVILMRTFFDPFFLVVSGIIFILLGGYLQRKKAINPVHSLKSLEK